jgi:hypothetical protein
MVHESGQFGQRAICSLCLGNSRREKAGGQQASSEVLVHGSVLA